MNQIKNLVEVIVCSIVDDIDNIRIVEEVTEQGLYYEITVSKDDVGKLIGKDGRVAKALRTITKASGAKNGIRVLLNVMDKPI